MTQWYDRDTSIHKKVQKTVSIVDVFLSTESTNRTTKKGGKDFMLEWRLVQSPSSFELSHRSSSVPKTSGPKSRMTGLLMKY